MAHPQTNFSSNFQGADGMDAKLDIKINGKSNEYQPSGGDKTVEVVAPVIFELSDNPTYAEVNDIVASHIPCYLHVSGIGVDCMAPYVGNASNAFRFETIDIPSKELIGWLIRNGASPVAYTSSYGFQEGPNIDISEGIISTEKTVVAAGKNVSVSTSFDPDTRLRSYKVNALAARYITRKIPTHIVTADDVNNGYVDIPIYIWPSDNMPSLDNLTWFLLITDAGYVRGGTGSSLQGYATKIKISWCDNDYTWMSYDNAHGNDPEGGLFESIPASDLARIGGYPLLVHPIRKIGGEPAMSVEIRGPSIRVMLEPGVAQADDSISIDGSIRCITE